MTRAGLNGFENVPTPQPVLDAFEAAIAALSAAGATVIDLDARGFTFPTDGNAEFLVLLFDFKGDIANYFATRVGVPVARGTLQTAIDFNNSHAIIEMPFFNQDIFELAQSITLDPDFVDPNFGLSYKQALAIGHNAGVNGIDLALRQFGLDAVVSATDNPAWATDLLYGDHFIFGTSGLAAPPGYPIVQVPAGMVFGVPLGISFFGTAFSEPKLIKLASGFEAATRVRARNLPTFADTVPFKHIDGTTPPNASSASPSSASPAVQTQSKTKPNVKKLPRHM